MRYVQRVLLAACVLVPSWCDAGASGADGSVTIEIPGSGGGFEDRSAPSTYGYDDGVGESASGMNATAWERCFMQRYDAVGGADLLTSVSVKWYAIPNGRPVRIVIFQDAVGNGDPSDRVLVAERSAVVANSANDGAGDAAVYSLDPPVPVSGVFFVGFSIECSGLEYPTMYDRTTPYVSGRGWIATTLTPPLNLGSALFVSGSPYNMTIRATGSGASFAYQGRLTNSGANYAGNADFRFTIYDSESGGAAVSPTFARASVPVVGGVFSLQVPGDPSWFVGAPDRYLEVEVRTPADGVSFTTLSPRERIGQVPAAMVATVATTAQGVTWTGVSGVPAVLPPWNSVPGGINYTGGSIGIGASSPGAPLAVRASGAAAQAFLRPDGVQRWDINMNSFGGGAPGLFFSESGVNPSNLVLREGGNVGIGTVPSFPFHVAAAGNSWPQAQIESASTIGTWFNLYNSSAGGVYWRMISTGSGNGEGAGKLLIGYGGPGGAAAQFSVMTLQQNGNVGIGNTSPSQRLTVNGNVLANNIAVPSSIRFKDHVSTMDDALESLLKLEGVRFDWKPEWAKERPGREHDIGFVAEDVAKVFPEVVFYDEDGNVTGMDYSRLTAVAVQAIKELKAAQQKQLETLQAQNAALQERLERLERAIGQNR